MHIQTYWTIENLTLAWNVFILNFLNGSHVKYVTMVSQRDLTLM